jgi:hypothetical protein
MSLEEQEETLHWVFDDLSQIDEAFAQRLLQLAHFLDAAETGVWDPFQAFNPDTYALALKLKTKKIKRRSATWKSFARKVYRGETPVPYEQDWQWSYAKKLLLHPVQKGKPSQAILELISGFLPRKKYWKSLTVGALDWDSSHQKTADYFSHVYRNRDGDLFEGIRLHDIWASGASFGVSDCEAIAWCRRIGNITNIHSPMSGPEQNKVYALIENDFTPWHEYQSLIDLVATKFLDPDAPLPKKYDRKVSDTINMAWVMVENDIAKMREVLKLYPTRLAFFDAVKKWKLTPPDDIYEDDWFVSILEGLEARKIEPKPIQESVLASLKAEGLLGIGRR